MSDPPPLVNLKLSNAEGPLARSLVVLEVKTPNPDKPPTRYDPFGGFDITYVLIGTGERSQAMVPPASKQYGGRGGLPLGEHKYNNFWFVMVDADGLSKLKERFGAEEVENRFMNFGEKRAYMDLELVALATLFTAGNMINKFLHVPMHRVRVARFAM